MENVILSKQAFAEEICNKLNEMYEGGGYSFTLQEVEKNNDVKILAVCVKPDDGNVAANCYVEASYKDYLKKPDLKESIIEDFCTVTMRNLKIPSFDIESIMNKDYVRANVIPVLVNKDNNKNSLNSLVSGERSDLAIIYKIQVQNDMLMGNGSIKVKPEHLTYLGMTEAELHEAAMSNLSKQGFNIKSMESFLFRMMSDDNSAALSESQGIDLSELKNINMPLFVITNNSSCDGANVLLQEDKLKEIGDALGFDYVIIPSSIHENVNKLQGYFGSSLKMGNSTTPGEFTVEDILNGGNHIDARSAVGPSLEFAKNIGLGDFGSISEMSEEEEERLNAALNYAFGDNTIGVNGFGFTSE